MKLTFFNNGKILAEDAKLIWRYFGGRTDEHNRNGERKFNIRIENPEDAERLMDAGCNVKISDNGDPGSDPFMRLEVKVSYRFYEPVAIVKTGRSVRQMDESTIGNLDKINIERADVMFHLGGEWTVQGNSGRTAYLDKIGVIQEEDRFMERYAMEEYPCE